MQVHAPFLNDCLLGWALSVSFLLATFGHGVYAYPQIKIDSLESNASSTLSSPDLSLMTSSYLRIVYETVSLDRMYTSSLLFSKET